jgi:hypothetical protein
VIRTVCDTCDKAIGRDGGGWFGVDRARLDDDGEPAEFDADHRYHFYSAACGSRWFADLAARAERKGN